MCIRDRNTIEAAVGMILKTGVDVHKKVEEDEKEVRITLRFPK
jgi:hypothetical protein